jgi:hypothetical protein
VNITLSRETSGAFNEVDFVDVTAGEKGFSGGRDTFEAHLVEKKKGVSRSNHMIPVGLVRAAKELDENGVESVFDCEDGFPGLWSEARTLRKDGFGIFSHSLSVA